MPDLLPQPFFPQTRHGDEQSHGAESWKQAIPITEDADIFTVSGTLVPYASGSLATVAKSVFTQPQTDSQYSYLPSTNLFSTDLVHHQ